MRPPRPEMSNAVPPPVIVRREPPPLLRVAGGLWLLGLVAGVAALALAFLVREDHLAALRDTVSGIDGGLAAEDAEQVAGIAFWGTLGAFAAILLATALLVRPLLRGGGWARWALLLLLLLDAGAVLLVQAFLATDATGFEPVPLLAMAQLVLVVLALVLSLLPPASRWFRGNRPGA